jgi:high-affinity iron transporter
MLGALVIVFREMLEAGLIVGIVLAAARGVAGRNLWVSIGVGGGILGAAVVAIFAGAISTLFEGAGQEMFNAIILGIAVLMLGWHTGWMASHGREMAREMKAVGQAVAEGAKPLTALAVVVGIAVLREGSEVVLFLYGIAASGGADAAGIVLGGLLGIAAGGAVSALMYFGLLQIPARHLFSATTWLITLLAAGLGSQAAAQLQQGGFVNVLADPLWDTSWLIADSSLLGRLLKTLVGYTDQPDGLQVIVYLAIVVAFYVLAQMVQRAHARAHHRGHALAHKH